MRPNLPFLLAASNTILKPDGLLKRKKWLVNDARPLLSLTEVMNIARLTSLLPRSSPRPRLRHGRGLALLSCPNLTSTYISLLCSVAGSSSSSPNFPNCSSPRESALIFADYLRYTFLSPSQRPCTEEP